MPATSPYRSTQPRLSPQRATVAGLLGVLGAVMLAGGTGFAYAAGTDTTESGYLTVVDEVSPSSATTDDDCPPTAGANGSSSEGGAL